MEAKFTIKRGITEVECNGTVARHKTAFLNSLKFKDLMHYVHDESKRTGSRSLVVKKTES